MGKLLPHLFQTLFEGANLVKAERKTKLAWVFPRHLLNYVNLVKAEGKVVNSPESNMVTYQ